MLLNHERKLIDCDRFCKLQLCKSYCFVNVISPEKKSMGHRKHLHLDLFFKLKIEKKLLDIYG